MRGLNIYLADGSYDGSITMRSDSSKISAIRVKKEDIPEYWADLDGPGIYMLLVGNDSVYVGQTGLDTIKKRILNTHSGDIDSIWHTVLAFKFAERTVSQNELEFIENAMCEYAYQNYPHCLTTTPAKAKCNAAYRNQHYHLSSGQIHSCNQYIEDIKAYISFFPGSIFPPAHEEISNSNVELSDAETALFHYSNPNRDSDGRAEIGIHLGHRNKRTAILKAGSKVSTEVSTAFKSSEKVIAHRKQLEEAGLLVDRILQRDEEFPSQSGAGEFLNGTSFDGNSNWKTVDGNVPLKQLLE
jgi:hypothetical protein